MMNSRARWVAAAMSAGQALGLSAVVVAGEAPLPGPPGLAPLAGVREEVVLARTLVGGNRLQVSRFADARLPEPLLQEVRLLWSQRPAPIHRSLREGWHTLMQLDGSSLETFAVRATGTGVEGRRSRLSKGDGGEQEASDWLLSVLPAGSSVIGRIGHADGGRGMTTLVAVTAASLAKASSDMSLALRRHGFRSGTQPSFATAAEGLPGKTMFFERAGQDVAVSIIEHVGERAVVMHWGRAIR
jgi:hypothetical protein